MLSTEDVEKRFKQGYLRNIACVSAQVPLLDGGAGGVDLLRRNGLGHALWMTFGHALRDLVRSWLDKLFHQISFLSALPGLYSGMPAYTGGAQP